MADWWAIHTVSGKVQHEQDGVLGALLWLQIDHSLKEKKPHCAQSQVV